MEASSSKAIDTGVNSDAPAEPWDPLQQNQAGPGSFRQPHDLAIVVEEDAASQDIVDANGRVLFTDEATRESPLGSRRASHLRLDLKPPSPQPWDLIDPPSDDGRKGGVDFCSTPGSRKFESMQNSSPARALIPKSSYYSGPPPSHSAYGTPPVGQIGRHHPREVLRIERDYTGGEVIQFAPIYPLELERRITPTQFLESINSINELLISAHSLRYSFLDNMLTVFTLQLSRHFLTSHYDKELARLRSLIDELNVGLYNPAGLHILWPGTVAFLFLEIEYYVSFLFCWTFRTTNGSPFSDSFDLCGTIKCTMFLFWHSGYQCYPILGSMLCYRCHFALVSLHSLILANSLYCSHQLYAVQRNNSHANYTTYHLFTAQAL
ncbi:hypothetical protein BDN72DRAFT_754048 [Pluteus cervinus]|uniref:Uncharacterized protein n=1 Tax=Pluteus cervinus TaxID=181527 RepID=A0ACD3BFI3_9AGAR|nr:hypothetical protein BDN72DRAFT_754048 [Pluteus cervinus]